MTRLRFGIVGVGNIAPFHAAAIRATPDAELVAVATRNQERGCAFVAEHGGAWCADYTALIARDDVDVVVLCTPHDLHAPMTLDAARAGKHIVCEKPMARTTSECDEMIAACENAGVTLGVIFQMRFEPLAQKLKTLIDAGKLGRLLTQTVCLPWYRTDAYYRSGAWRGTLAHEGGGVLINQAIHLLDLMLWLTGAMPARVSAQMRTLARDIQVEDVALAILEYADGHLGSVQATTIAYPGFPERLEFYGTQGSAIYHKGSSRLEWHCLEPRDDGEQATEANSGAANPVAISAAAHIAQYQDFASALREHRAPLVDGREGRRSVELVEAIYRAARLNTAVQLPLG